MNEMTTYEKCRRDLALSRPDFVDRFTRARFHYLNAVEPITAELARLAMTQPLRFIRESDGSIHKEDAWSDQMKEFKSKIDEISEMIWRKACQSEGLEPEWFVSLKTETI